MKVYRKVFSPIDVNTYIITGDETSCIVIDCGCYGEDEEKEMEETLGSLGLTPVLLLNTHCHLDHVFGNNFMLEKYKLRARCHQEEMYNLKHAPEHAMMFGLSMEMPPETDRNLADGEVIKAAGLTLEVIAVPGHSPGGVAFLCREDGILFSGDSLFAGSIGRSDLHGGDHEKLIENIRTRLFTLPRQVKVMPGHGPETTIGIEMKSNPFFS